MSKGKEQNIKGEVEGEIREGKLRRQTDKYIENFNWVAKGEMWVCAVIDQVTFSADPP